MNQEKNKLKLYNDDHGPSFIESNSFLWVRKNSNLLFYILLGLIILFILIYKTGSYRSSRSESDYFMAEKEYQKILKSMQDGEKNDSLKSSFESLQKILKNSPSLASKYEGVLTEAYIIDENNKEALLYGKNVLSRVKKNNLPYYNNFSEITLLIANNELENSLEESLILKTNLEKEKEKDEQSFSYLEKIYAYNLLRIPFLQQKLEKYEEALSSWQKLDEYLYLSKSETIYFQESKNLLENLFSSEKISLKNYIQNQINAFEKPINSK